MPDIALWKNNTDIEIRDTDDVNSIVVQAKQLKNSDHKQIISAFNSGNYQMLSTYVWSRTITAIKAQLSKMGSAFVGEMLDRPDINEYTNIQHALTDFEAVQLAEDLGLIGSKSAFRLKQAMDLLAYFNNPDEDESEGSDFNKVDATQVLISCVQGVLGHDKIELQIDFKTFRNSLEENVLNEESPNVVKLLQSPYFFKRATIRILLSIIKSAISAQLETSLANANLIIPKIWNDVKQPEKWQVGRCYAELYTEGKSTAMSGLKQVLLKVKGFDFVPEDLRSTSFIKAASEIIRAHEGINNFYYEEAPVKILKDMGSTIPIPAFPSCMSAVLSVKLGNSWGIAWNAQAFVNSILSNITTERWVYYFQECLPSDNRIVYKLTATKPQSQWIELIISINSITEIINSIKNPYVKQLLQATLDKNSKRIYVSALRIKEQTEAA